MPNPQLLWHDSPNHASKISKFTEIAPLKASIPDFPKDVEFRSTLCAEIKRFGFGLAAGSE